ncbi:UDP-GlcNAc:undecaprenyl-phosphate GlcNAc-1-phosphate transferase [Mycetocola sp. BIGb0189]|uniref:MraY family glycosyltransferase n=1 Tax=Mycetocola sp. BIGb0189 TaxID=2940604 RepID=UPI002168605E|nr:MraY family glycosyltransferase [Mycetocola sp. BIGb0189]MCS4274900.1 UDP-GlcNAc:undecaprenyl-phosphate GlcNAc-1-phosphate transferase [Mycetocola sp. BIGb0189]
MIQYVLVAAITAVVTWLLSRVVYRVALKYKLYPEIRERDVHTRPTPRLGGVAMFLGVIVAFIYASTNPFLAQTFADAPGQLWAVLGAAGLIVIIGVLDDLIDLDWMIKLAAQFVAAGIIAFSGVQFYSLPIGGLTVGSSQASFVLTTFTLVLIMNAVNFIDGLDGLVAGVGLIANGAFLIYGYLLVRSMGQTSFFNLPLLLSAILVGICAGFLPMNWHPAKMFMGDAGALLLGLLMATSAVAITGQIDPSALGVGQDTALFGRSQLIGAFIPIILPVAILVVPLLDFFLAVFRRTAAGTSPFTADRKHLHHRLLDMGHSHLQAVLVFYAWTAVISASCLIAFVVSPSWIALTFLTVGVIGCTLWTFAPRLNRWRDRSVEVREAREAGVPIAPEPFRRPKHRDDTPAPQGATLPEHPQTPAAKDPHA